MILVLKIAAILLLSFVIVFACFKMVMKRLLSNHRFFATISKSFYNYFYSLKDLHHLRTNNFGYAPIDEDIAHYDPDLQYGIQLYKELVKNHHGYLIPEKSAVVEVGCGKGAGAEFLLKKFNPGTYTGIDFSEKAINFCNKTYKQIPNANFICADAHRLPVDHNSVDVVINVESSHLYKDQDKFFSGVHNILKAKGKFLFTDYRRVKNCSIDTLEKQISDCGFSITEKRIITPQVKNACMLASERRNRLVEMAAPRYLKKYFRHYAVLNGTKKSAMLANGEIIYFIYHLEKK